MDVTLTLRPRISANSRVHRGVDAASGRRSTADTKAKRKTAGRTTGRLQRLMDLPVEIFLLIVTHLSPLDLLHLSRTCKQFRATFMVRSARHFWVAARRNVPEDLPKPPPCISEPKYASIIFERCCSACGVGRSSHVDHGIMVRFCAACWKLNISLGRQLERHNRGKMANIEFNFLTTVVRVSTSIFSDSLERNGPDQRYYIPEFDAVLERYLELAAQDKAAAAMLVKERRDNVVQMLKHACAVHAWEKRCQEAQFARSQRREASIKEKLYALGYQDSDFPMNSTWLSLVSQTRDLTPRIWKQIQPKLEAAIVEEQQRCLRYAIDTRVFTRLQELSDAYDAHIRGLLQTDLVLPSLSELLSIPEIDRLIREDDARAPIDQDSFIERFLPIVEAYPNENKLVLIREFVEKTRQADCRDIGYNVDVGDDPDDLARMFDKVKQHAAFMLSREQIGLSWTSGIDTYVQFEHYSEVSASLDPWASAAMRRKEISVDPRIALAVLKMLHLPADSSYSDVSGKVVCLCGNPGFQQPASFGELITHISLENAWYEHMMQQCNQGVSTQSEHAVYNDHDLNGEIVFVRLLADGEDYGDMRPSVSDLDLLSFAEFARPSCQICYDLLNTSTSGSLLADFGPTMSMSEWVNHVMSKHRKIPTMDDVLKYSAD